MRTLLAVAFVTLISVSSQASVLWDNGYANADGYFSDAYSSNATYQFGQTMGDTFTLGSASTIQNIEFKGSSQNLRSNTLSNMSAFEFNIFDSSDVNVYSATIALGSLNATLTGNQNSPGGLEYDMNYNTSVNLGAGTYMFNVGAVLIDPTVDAFAWSNGQNDSINYFKANTGSGWSSWNSFGDNGGAFVLTGAVPEPASMTVLGLGVLALIRRRKA